jgi:hypothetical protein
VPLGVAGTASTCAGIAPWRRSKSISRGRPRDL